METWEKINAAIEAILTASTEGKEGDAKVAAYNAEALKLQQGIRQHFNDGGRSAQKLSDGKKITTLEAEVTALKTEAETKDTRITELESSDAGGDQKLVAANLKIEELKTENKSLVGKHSTDKAEWETSNSSSMIGQFRTELQALAGDRLHADYLELQLIKMDQAGRFATEVGADGKKTVSVKQPGKTMTYMDESRNSLLETVCSELISGAPDDRKKTGAKGGGGIRPNGEAGSGSQWDKIREDAIAGAKGRGDTSEADKGRLAGLT